MLVGVHHLVPIKLRLVIILINVSQNDKLVELRSDLLDFMVSDALFSHFECLANSFRLRKQDMVELLRKLDLSFV